MNDATAIDMSVATAEDLENLSLHDLLGQDISDISMVSNLPDGTYVGLIEDYEKKVFPAKPEQGKNASIALNMRLKVHHAEHISDPSIDTKSVENRVHFESYFLTSDRGPADLVKLLLGILGVKYTDKAAIKEVGQSPLGLLEELKSNNVYFGFTVKNTERGGYENCNIIHKQDKFIDMEKTAELMG